MAGSSPRVVSPFLSVDHVHSRCLRGALSAAESACAREGLRLTPLRRRVLELIWTSHEPVKAYDLLDRLRGERRRAAPPTVYRALDFLLEHGLVHKIESRNAYVGCGRPGHGRAAQFLICNRCGEAAEIADGEILDLIAAKADAMGFSMQAHTIEVTGCCASCRQGG